MQGMQNKKKLPIGISDFKKLISNNQYYIDKSLFIKEIIEASAEVLLLPRPRRFGKTLNLSMLRYFFDNTEKSNSHLFEKLKIWKAGKKYQEMQGAYPVIYLTLKTANANIWDECLYKLKSIISDEFLRHSYLLNEYHLHELEKNYFVKIQNGTGNTVDFEESLEKLSKFLERYYQKKVIILIDEYDAPIHGGFFQGYYDKTINFMKGFLGNAFKDNTSLEKGIITGILRISKESIFSGLNNLDVYTILSKKYSDKFGLTPDEIKLLLSDYELKDEYEKLNQWYNGYCFGDTTIFNPWSIINYVNNIDDGLKPYWINTSSNDLIKKLIIEGKTDLKSDFELLLEQKEITKTINENIVFTDLEKNSNAVWSFLVFTGYLKAYDQKLLSNREHYKLSIPNIEIFTIFEDIIYNWLNENIGSDKLEQMLKAFTQGDVTTFELILQDFMINMFSYHDISADEPEKVYQAFVLGLLVNLEENYQIKSNRESGYGRYDVMVIPKDTTQKGIIIEFKKIIKLHNETTETALTKALQQIKEKKYAQELIALGIKDIIEMGIVFDGKRVWVRQA